MILDNYKKILAWYKTGVKLKDVSGDNTVNIQTYIGGQGSSAYYNASGISNSKVINNHEIFGVAQSFNYDTTTATNSCTDEQTAYKWVGVVNSVPSTGVNYFYNQCYNGFILFVGTGDTAPAATDYKLATPATLDVTSASCTNNSNGRTFVQRTFQNNTGADVTIKELGCYVFKCCSSVTEANNTAEPIIMIARTVLETPVTIANGDSQTFTYVIENVIE